MSAIQNNPRTIGGSWRETLSRRLVVLARNWWTILIGILSICAGAGILGLASGRGHKPDVIEWAIGQLVALGAGYGAALAMSASMKRGQSAFRRGRARNNARHERSVSLGREWLNEVSWAFSKAHSVEGIRGEHAFVSGVMRLVWSGISRGAEQEVREWCTESWCAIFDLARADVKAELTAVTTVEKQKNVLLANRKLLNSVAGQLARAPAMIRAANFAGPNLCSEVINLSRILAYMREESLLPVLREIELFLPNVFDKCKGRIWNTTTVIYAVISVIGFVYVSGFLAYLGLPLRSVLRSGSDLLLIGFLGGSAPIGLFAAYIGYEYMRVRRSTTAARGDHATVEIIVHVLAQMEDMHAVEYWAWRCVVAFLVAGNVAVLMAFGESRYGGKYMVTFDGGPTIEARMLGGIGEFTFLGAQKVAENHWDRYRVVVVPSDLIKCITVPRGGAASVHGSDCRPARANGATGIMEAGTVEPPKQPVERDAWEAFIQKVAHCNPQPISVGDREYLVSPVFKNGNGSEFSLAYYDTHKYEECRKWNDGVVEGDPKKCWRTELSKFYEAVRRDEKRDKWKTSWTINFIGFASSTADPPFDELVSTERAQTVMTEMLREIPEDANAFNKNCVRYAFNEKLDARGAPVKCQSAEYPVYQAWGVREMPSFLWLGRHGDATQRVVMVAACDRNI